MQTRKNAKKQSTSMRLIGAQLALFRTNAGFTQRKLADLLCVHEETVASIEQGRRPLLPDMAEQVDRILKTGGALAVGVEHVSARERYPVWAEEFMAHEKEAISHYSYENQVIPGLLQTEDYARATFRTTTPSLSEEEIELCVAARIERQELLHRKVPVTFSFILSEDVLHCRLGGSEVMHEQIRHLRIATDFPGVSIQVMPLAYCSHAGLSGPFVLLETPSHQQLAYVEAQLGGRLFSEPDDVSVLTRKYGMLRTQALNSKETQSLLDRLLGET
ncbi:helix-turn-helix domain-containing protein [Streptomyces syringium]|uniref:helix-turn-helix domain-containing protein n=1 Tax=Streptomyces syringium TaxID=76729 RepID=UPI0033E8D0FB